MGELLSKRKSILDGLDKDELLQHLEWALQVVEVAAVMKDWTQNDRLRTAGTLLAALMYDESSDSEQVERIQDTILKATPCIKQGVAERMADPEHMTGELRARLALLSGGKN